MKLKARLPLLEEYEGAYKTCAYCPKLCRTTCPVSAAEPTESLTPWGKMSLGFELSRPASGVANPAPLNNPGDADPIWGCTGCGACTAFCLHDNPVERGLYAARAQAVSLGKRPPHDAGKPRSSLLRRLQRIQSESERMLRDLSTRTVPTGRASGTQPKALLMGCAYLFEPELSSAVFELASGLLGNVRLIQACCGAPLVHMGEIEEARLAQSDLRAKVASFGEVIVADPGCKRMCDFFGEHEAKVPLLLDKAVEGQHLFTTIEPEEVGQVRYHDPCQLGRGLGRYQEPRALLRQITGRDALEFSWRLEDARCSGAGGGLPKTMPDISRRIVRSRLEEHEALGGGAIVTACGSSLRKFRLEGSTAFDLHELLGLALKERRERLTKQASSHDR